MPFAFGDQLLTGRDGTLLCSAGPEWYGYLGIIDTEASTWAPAIGRPSKSGGCLAAQKKEKKKKKHGHGVSWRPRSTIPIDKQIRTQELHSQSLSPKKNRWCFSAKRMLSGKIVLVATCILVCTAPFKLCSSLTVQSADIRKRRSGLFPNSANTRRAHHGPSGSWCNGTVHAQPEPWGVGLHLLQKSGTWSRQRVKMRTQKRCNRARWLHPLDPELSDENGRNIVRHACRLYKDFILCHRSQKEFTRTNTDEFVKACQDLHWNHDTGTPHRSETKRVAERAVRRVKEGIDIALVQSELPEEWSDCAMPLLLAQRSRQNGRWQNSIGEKLWQKSWRTINTLWIIGWVHPNCRERQVESTSVWKENVERNILRLCATCGRRLVRILDGSRSWRFARIRNLWHLSQKIPKPRSLCSSGLRISVCERNFNTYLSSKTVFNSRGTPRAWRWCWNRGRRQKGKQNRRVVVQEWNICTYSTSWRQPQLKLYDTDNETNISDPIEIRRRNETNSDEFQQCFVNGWSMAKGVNLSEEWSGTAIF